jgi:hypothetical protein
LASSQQMQICWTRSKKLLRRTASLELMNENAAFRSRLRAKRIHDACYVSPQMRSD